VLSAAHQRLGNLAHADQIPDADNRSDLLAIADETHESTQHSSTAAQQRLCPRTAACR